MHKTPKHLAGMAILAATAGLAYIAPAAAQTSPMMQVAAPATTPDAAPLTRMQARMDRDEFLKTHRWDPVSDTWSLRQGIEPPVGVKTRAEVKAERDEFLRNNKWDDARSGWRPMGGTPRDLNAMSREQVRRETAQFTRTHRWDEPSESWVDKRASMAK